MSTKVLFIGAKTFSGTGGIEQVNKSWIYCLSQHQNVALKSLILADDKAGLTYTNHSFFRGYIGNKIKFLLAYFRYALQADLLIVSHVQLAILIPLLKILKPKLQTLVICHGIEVWGKLNTLQLSSLKRADQLLAVSNFTKNKLISLHQLDAKKMTVFPNALDPFFNAPDTFVKPEQLLKRYQIEPTDIVLVTIARLSSAEQYKGYDFVIESLKYLKEEYPNIKYIIGGKADDEERQRLENLVRENGLELQVILPGFIATGDMIPHYQLADIFTMPSTGEGFGISFIEAASCGTPVLGGNTDGSSDAIIQGITGELCTPKNPSEIAKALRQILTAYKNPQLIQQSALKNYSFAVYNKRIVNLLAKSFNII
jgi:phosphatidylinositol alpha-1,6-mannosyltransferase